MCGIAGIWNLSGNSASVETLHKMLSVQQHRGPEDAAYTSMADGAVLLGFLKLAFTDQQLGMQPLFNEDGSIAIVYNGEIYDYEALRADLVAKGHQFYTHSDSEVLIHLYEEYGESFVHQLNGEFAFVIYDDNKKQIFAARDPFGINPLTYTFVDGTFYFSSEAKGILVTDTMERALSPEYLHSVALGIPNTRLTIFKGIQNLRPGHYMLIDRNGIQKHEQYWNPSFEKTKADFKTAQTRVREELKNALARRLAGNPPIALSLSSGIDSTIIAGLSKELGYSTPVFSLGYTGRSYDESEIAAASAQHFGLPFNRVELSMETIVANFEKTLYHTENITNSLANSARFLMDKAVRDSGLKAITGGEASDEIFGGYPYFVLEALWRRQLAGDSEAKQLFKRFAKNEKKSQRIFWDKSNRWKKHKSPYPTGPVLAYLRAENAGMLSRLWAKPIQKAFRTAFEGVENPSAALFLEELPPQACAELSGFDTTRLMSRSIISTFGFPGLGDRIEMGNSLEGRVPFLDKNLVEYAYTLPESYCLNINEVQGKYILREAFSDLLPAHFKAPSKHTFMSPTFSEAFKTSIGKELYQKYLTNQKIKDFGIIHPTTWKMVKTLWKIMPKGLPAYLFVDSLIGLMMSVQILQERFVHRHPMDGIAAIKVRLLSPTGGRVYF